MAEELESPKSRVEFEALRLTDGEWESALLAKAAERTHVPKILPKGTASLDYWAMVHTPVDIDKARFIPRAQEAIDKQWKQLIDGGAWLTETVREKQDVIDEAKLNGKTVHIGSLMTLCH